MKKIIFAGIGVALLGVVAYASEVITNNSIGIKSTASGATEEQSMVTAGEFNALVDVLRGVNNADDFGDRNIGLNTTSEEGADLKINGLMRIDMDTGVENCSEVGTIFYNSDNKHFWGCKSFGSDPVQLDVVECP